MKELRMQQIVVAPWSAGGKSSYSLFGLSDTGKVYRYDPPCEGWLPNGMIEATCLEEHRKKKNKVTFENKNVEVVKKDEEINKKKPSTEKRVLRFAEG